VVHRGPDDARAGWGAAGRCGRSASARWSAAWGGFTDALLGLGPFGTQVPRGIADLVHQHGVPHAWLLLVPAAPSPSRVPTCTPEPAAGAAQRSVARTPAAASTMLLSAATTSS
jgi:hypothetical protein